MNKAFYCLTSIYFLVSSSWVYPFPTDPDLQATPEHIRKEWDTTTPFARRVLVASPLLQPTPVNVKDRNGHYRQQIDAQDDNTRKMALRIRRLDPEGASQYDEADVKKYAQKGKQLKKNSHQGITVETEILSFLELDHELESYTFDVTNSKGITQSYTTVPDAITVNNDTHLSCVLEIKKITNKKKQTSFCMRDQFRAERKLAEQIAQKLQPPSSPCFYILLVGEGTPEVQLSSTVAEIGVVLYFDYKTYNPSGDGQKFLVYKYDKGQRSWEETPSMNLAQFKEQLSGRK